VAIKLGKKSSNKTKTPLLQNKPDSATNKSKSNKTEHTESLYNITRRTLSSAKSTDSCNTDSKPTSKTSSKKKMPISRSSSAIPDPAARMTSSISLACSNDSVSSKQQKKTASSSAIPITRKKLGNANVEPKQRSLLSSRASKKSQVVPSKSTMLNSVPNSGDKVSRTASNITITSNVVKIKNNTHSKEGKKTKRQKKGKTTKRKSVKKKEVSADRDTDTSFEDELAEFKTVDGEFDEEKYRISVLKSLSTFGKPEKTESKKKKRYVH